MTIWTLLFRQSSEHNRLDRKDVRVEEDVTDHEFFHSRVSRNPSERVAIHTSSPQCVGPAHPFRRLAIRWSHQAAMEWLQLNPSA